MRTKYKKWAVDYLELHEDISLKSIDMDDEFFSKKPIALEIGSGKGDFIIGMSKLQSEKNFLAVERVQTVAGMMLKKIVDAEITNVKVFSDDVARLFSSIGEEKIETIYLNFVDPWPKKKHAKRRLTYISFLNEYYRILKKGGSIIFKSDNAGLYDFSLKELKKTPFNIVVSDDNYAFNDEEDAMSEYEAKFRKEGINIHRIVAKK